MAKRGRPTVEQRNADFLEWTTTNRIVQGLFTNGGSKRSMTNAYYSTVANSFFSEAASKFPEVCTIPHWDEIQLKNCITEQLGRMIAQDRYEGYQLVMTAQEAAKAYHNGQSAKSVAAGLRRIRKSGVLDDTPEGGTT